MMALSSTLVWELGRPCVISADARDLVPPGAVFVPSHAVHEDNERDSAGLLERQRDYLLRRQMQRPTPSGEVGAAVHALPRHSQ